MPKPFPVMPETRAQRTLVKSPPELWAEISDAPSLARRLSAFGEVRITRKDPETAVAWEGASVRGTVELAASGWGTKVTIAAERTPAVPEPAEQDTVAFDSAEPSAALADEPEPETAPEPDPVTTASVNTEAPGTDIPSQDEGPAPREGFLARLKGWWHTGSWAAQPAPAAPPTQEHEHEQPPAVEVPEVEPEVRAEAPEPAPAPEPQATAEPEPTPEPDPDPELEGQLVAILDDLGSAHHRPFSRA